MPSNKIFVLLGHPHNASLCAAIAEAYAQAAEAVGAEVRVQRIADMQFDPSLHAGFASVQALEPDLLQFQENLAWCGHFVMVFPLWWGGMPGALKGLIDRTFLPRFAFKYKEGSPFQDKLLAGRTAHVFLTSDSPNLWYNLVLGRPLTKQLRRQILGFCGFKPVKVTVLGNVRASTPEKRAGWLKKVAAFGQKAGA